MNFLQLSEPVYGGWIAFTHHLSMSFKALGHCPNIYKLGNNDEKKERPFYDMTTYRNLAAPSMTQVLTSKEPKLITSVDKHNLDFLLGVKPVNTALVIHDPTEFKGTLLDWVRKHKVPVVGIRKKPTETMVKNGVNARFIRHPYWQAPVKIKKEKKLQGVCFSRVDWDKNTHVIAEANESLEFDQRISIYGAMNNLYWFNKIKPIAPHWNEYYFGKFPKTSTAQAELAAASRWVVDLSVIVGDGGGTQYTFLEAWDQGTPLIIHSAWVSPGDDMRVGVNCLAAGTAEELVLAIKSRDNLKLAEQGRVALQNHKPSAIVPQYLGLFK